MGEPVIQIVQGKQLRYATFFCPFCCERHTIAVRRPGEKIPLDVGNVPIFEWNGSLDKPVIGPRCVMTYVSDRECHVWFNRAGIIRNNSDDKQFGMTPVKDWPPLLPPPNPEAKKAPLDAAKLLSEALEGYTPPPPKPPERLELDIPREPEPNVPGAERTQIIRDSKGYVVTHTTRFYLRPK